MYRPIVISNHRVLISTFGAEIIALQAIDGAIAWKTKIDVAAVHAVTDDNAIFLNRIDGSITSLDSNDGHLLWTQTIRGSMSYPPTFNNGIGIAGDENANVLTFDTHSGHKISSLSGHSAAIASPALLNNNIMVPSQDRLGRFRWVFAGNID